MIFLVFEREMTAIPLLAASVHDRADGTADQTAQARTLSDCSRE
jgi:hypothetical protein